jgi:threonine/homoserine/homoserine lactone efflux protein
LVWRVLQTDWAYFIAGIIFGLGAGLTPGPLMTLVFTETLKHGTREGIKVSMAPLITDLPIILLSIYLISSIADIEILLGIISFIGAGYLIYLGWQSVRFKGVDVDAEKIAPQSIKKGILANVFNPNPYVFWVSVGAPLILKAADINRLTPFLFILSMYACLVGSKILTAILLGKSRQFLKTRNYIFVLKGLGMVLFGFAVYFLYDALRFFKCI